VTPIRADALLALPVRLHGIALGHPVDVLLDRSELRVVGLDLVCGDDTHRFLPFATAGVDEDEITIRSPLVLLEEDELAFYRTRTLALATLRGQPIVRGERAVGRLLDVVVGSGGAVEELVVEGDAGVEHVRFDGSVRVGPVSRTAA
jgi:hypothetical protein